MTAGTGFTPRQADAAYCWRKFASISSLKSTLWLIKFVTPPAILSLALSLCSFKGLLGFGDLLYCMLDTIKKNVTSKQIPTGMSYICDLHLEEVLLAFNYLPAHCLGIGAPFCRVSKWVTPGLPSSRFAKDCPGLHLLSQPLPFSKTKQNKQTNKNSKPYFEWVAFSRMKNYIIIIKKNSCNFG